MELRRGDSIAGFAEADIVVEREFQTPMVHQGYIEPHACVARWGQDGRAVVWTTTQGPFVVRDGSAAILGIDAAAIKVIPTEIGGGFGGKITVYLEPLALVLSRKANRPVKMVMTREEVFRATGPTSGTKVRVKIGAKPDGTLVAATASLWYEGGAYPGSPSGAGAMCCLAPYRIPNFLIEAYDVVVNKPKVAAYRAPGSPMAAFATESVIDEIARTLGMDPIELRLKNAVVEGDARAVRAQVRADRADGRCSRRPGVTRTGRRRSAPNQGRGVACGFWFNAGMNSSATDHARTATAAPRSFTGNPDIGGTRVAQALMVAEELGIPVERVRPIVADTDTAGYTDVTGGSRVCYATGMAVIEAARDVREQLRARAAKIWNIDVSNGRLGRRPARSAERRRRSFAAHADGARRQGQRTPAARSSAARRSTSPTAGPAFGAHICDLEVDKETGRSTVVRYTAIQDVGKAVHPSFVEGQMQGGAAQGIGWALNEEYVFDAAGVMENAGFLDYRMPVASDLPMIDTVIVEVPNPIHPYGVRGVGEVPIVPPLAAVANAMRDATGVRFTELPLSPPRVLAGLMAAGD